MKRIVIFLFAVMLLGSGISAQQIPVVTNPTTSQTVIQPGGTNLSANVLNNYYQAGQAFPTGSTIQAAISAAGTNGTVIIPASYLGSDSYTNPNNIGILDWRTGTAATPLTGRTFVNPALYLPQYSNGVTTLAPTQGYGALAPQLALVNHEYGSAATEGIYSETNCEAGCSAYTTGPTFAVIAQQGSMPLSVNNNWVITDESFIQITSCTSIAGGGTGNETCMFLGANNIFKTGGGIFISGNSNSALNTNNSVGVITSYTANAVTFTNPSNNTALSGSGGSAGTPHQLFAFELNANNLNHDPNHPNPLNAQNALLPVNGITFTGNAPQQGLTFFPFTYAFGAQGSYYTGFNCPSAIDYCFRAGDYQAGGPQITSKYGLLNDITYEATSSIPNPKSMTLGWRESNWNGSSNVDSDWGLFVQNGVMHLQYQGTDILTITNNGAISTPTVNYGHGANSTYDSNTSKIALVSGPSGGEFVNNASNAALGSWNNNGNFSFNTVAAGNGFTGTKTAGSCTFTINAGIITNVTGC